MTTRTGRHIVTALALLLAGASLLASSPGRATGDGNAADATVVVLIVGRDFALQELSSSMVQRVFRGEQTDAGGKRLVPFNYAPDQPLRRRFDEIVLGMTPDEVGRYWVDRRIRGQGMPPRTVPSPAVARAVVGRLAGALSYVRPTELDATVRALRIDGKTHDDPRYVFRSSSR